MTKETHIENIDNALDAAAEDSDLATHEYRQVLEETRTRIDGALAALKEEGW